MNLRLPILKGVPAGARWCTVILLLAVSVGCNTLLVDSYDYGTIEVQVLMESGQPAVGFPLVLYRDTELLAYGSTNAAGEYTFKFVPFGVVGVYLQLAPEYETIDSKPSDYRHNIDLSDGGRVSLVFSGIRRTGAPAGESAESRGSAF